MTPDPRATGHDAVEGGAIDAAAPPTLVLLHGHDDDPATFTPLAERAGAALGPDTVVVVPIGPVETGSGRRAWWDVDDRGLPEPGAVAAAVADLEAVVAELLQLAGGPVVVGGFSQGGALALTWAGDPDRGVAPAGLFALAAWLPDPDTAGLDLDPSRAAGLPVLLVYGEDDEAVPPPASRSAARVLERAGAAVTLTEVAAGHTPADAFLPALTAWLTTLR